MTASPSATLIAAPALPSVGISTAPGAHLHEQRRRRSSATTSASPPDAYRKTFLPELLNSGMSPTPTHNSAGARRRTTSRRPARSTGAREQRAGRRRSPRMRRQQDPCRTCGTRAPPTRDRARARATAPAARRRTPPAARAARRCRTATPRANKPELGRRRQIAEHQRPDPRLHVGDDARGRERQRAAQRAPSARAATAAARGPRPPNTDAPARDRRRDLRELHGDGERHQQHDDRQRHPAHPARRRSADPPARAPSWSASQPVSTPSTVGSQRGCDRKQRAEAAVRRAGGAEQRGDAQAGDRFRVRRQMRRRRRRAARASGTASARRSTSAPPSRRPGSASRARAVARQQHAEPEIDDARSASTPTPCTGSIGRSAPRRGRARARTTGRSRSRRARGSIRETPRSAARCAPAASCRATLRARRSDSRRSAAPARSRPASARRRRAAAAASPCAPGTRRRTPDRRRAAGRRSTTSRTSRRARLEQRRARRRPPAAGGRRDRPGAPTASRPARG